MNSIYVARGQNNYPSILEQLSDPPKGLYIRGQIHLQALNQHPVVGVVGTRRADPTGRKLARQVGQVLAQAQCVVVSGLALGIDAEAHHGVLEAKGKTVAVLGSGLADTAITPAQHLGLAHAILQNGGALISEYPDTYPAGKYTYPARNRIIAGLCSHLIVIQAPIGSGALITVDHALALGRSIATFPGPALHAGWQGSNQLLKDGAEVLCRPDEVLDWLGLRGQTHLPFDSANQNKKNPTLDKLVSILKQAPHTTSELLELTDLSSANLLQELNKLELNGWVQLVGGRWRLVDKLRSNHV